MREKRNNYRKWTPEEMVTALDRFIQEKKRLPVAKEMNSSNDLPSRRTFESTMGVGWWQYARLHYPELVEQNEARHWSNMLKSRKELSEWTEEKLVDAVMTFAEQHGHLPSKQEYTSENGLPSYIMFCKMAEQILTESLERNFEKYFVQNNDLEQDEEKLDEEQSCGMQI